MFDTSLLGFSLEPHFHFCKKHTLPPVETVKGSGDGWTKEVIGNVDVRAVPGRTTLALEGAGAMKIIGSLKIGG